MLNEGGRWDGWGEGSGGGEKETTLLEQQQQKFQMTVSNSSYDSDNNLYSK